MFYYRILGNIFLPLSLFLPFVSIHKLNLRNGNGNGDGTTSSILISPETRFNSIQSTAQRTVLGWFHRSIETKSKILSVWCCAFHCSSSPLCVCVCVYSSSFITRSRRFERRWVITCKNYLFIFAWLFQIYDVVVRENYIYSLFGGKKW